MGASCASSSSSSSSSSPSAHPFPTTAATATAAIRAYIACFFALRRFFICARRQAHTFVLAMEIVGGDADGGIGVGGRWTCVLLSGALGCRRWNQVEETKRPRARRQKERMCRKRMRKMVAIYPAMYGGPPARATDLVGPSWSGLANTNKSASYTD